MHVRTIVILHVTTTLQNRQHMLTEMTDNSALFCILCKPDA